MSKRKKVRFKLTGKSSQKSAENCKMSMKTNTERKGWKSRKDLTTEEEKPKKLHTLYIVYGDALLKESFVFTHPKMAMLNYLNGVFLDGGVIKGIWMLEYLHIAQKFCSTCITLLGVLAVEPRWNDGIWVSKQIKASSSSPPHTFLNYSFPRQFSRYWSSYLSSLWEGAAEPQIRKSISKCLTIPGGRGPSSRQLSVLPKTF